MTTPSLSGELPKLDAKQVRNGPSIGGSGLKHWGGYIHEEFLPELRGQRAARVYDEMRRNEPIIASMLTAIFSILQSIEWTVEPRSKSAADKKAAELLDQAQHSMDDVWEDTVTDILTMFPFGWALLEIVYKMEDGKILWKKLPLRGQESLERWDIDDQTGEIQAFVQRPAPHFKELKIPSYKFALFRTNKEKNNAEGVSVLRAAYKPWYYKKVIEEIEAIGLERDLIGIPVMDAPFGASAKEINEAKEIVERVKNDEQAGLVLPAIGREDYQKWAFRLVTGQGSSSKVSFTDRSIQRYTMEMQMSTLAHFLRLGQQGGGGSYKLSSDQRDAFQLAVRGWAQIMKAAINKQLAERLLRLNGMDPRAAHFIHGRIGSLDLQTLTNFVTAGVQNRYLTLTRADEEFLRREAEMPELNDSEDAVAEWKRETDMEQTELEIESTKKDVKAKDEENKRKKDNSGLNDNPGDNQSGTLNPIVEKSNKDPQAEKELEKARKEYQKPPSAKAPKARDLTKAEPVSTGERLQRIKTNLYSL